MVDSTACDYPSCTNAFNQKCDRCGGVYCYRHISRYTDEVDSSVIVAHDRHDDPIFRNQISILDRWQCEPCTLRAQEIVLQQREAQQREHERLAPQRAEQERLRRIESEKFQRQTKRRMAIHRFAMMSFIGLQVIMFAAAAVSEHYAPSMISEAANLTFLIALVISLISGILAWKARGLAAAIVALVVQIVAILVIWG